MPAASSPLRRRNAAAVLALTVAVALTACVDGGAGPTSTPGTPAPSSSGAPAAPTTAPPEDDEPLVLSCADLVDLQAVYAFDPNYALLDSWTPSTGTPAAEARAAGGVACRLVRESGGGTIDFSVAELTEEQIRERKNAAFADSTMVPTYGDEAYFEVEDGVGTAIVFQGRYWLVISSGAFAEPGEPTEIVDAALAALPAD